MVPCPRMEKQWSTANVREPDGSRDGRYVSELNMSISCWTPTGSVSGDSGPPGFAATGMIGQPANLVFERVALSFFFTCVHV